MSRVVMEPHEQAYSYCAYCPKVCRFACPVSEATSTESTSTWGKMNAAHLVQASQRPLDEGSSQALHACTGCGRCQSVCKHQNDVASALFAARSEAITHGLQPRGASSTLATFAQAQNPFGVELGALAATFRSDSPVRTPLFPGCTALTKNPQLIEDAIAVSAAFGTPMGVGRASGRCCGYPLYAAGAFELFKAHAEAFAQSLESYPELAVLDPGCAFTMKVVYPRFGVRLATRVRTVTELLAENLPHAPALAPLGESVGYHDACHLGRGLGEYEPPRALLKRAVADVREAAASHEQGGCAGGGGLLPRTMPEVAAEVARRQAGEVSPDGEPVVTACLTSQRMFERAGRPSENLLSVLHRWLKSGGDERT